MTTKKLNLKGSGGFSMPGGRAIALAITNKSEMGTNREITLEMDQNEEIPLFWLGGGQNSGILSPLGL